MKNLGFLFLLLANLTLFAQDRQAMEQMAMQAYRSGDYRTAYHQLFLSKQAYSSKGEKEDATRCWLYMCSALLFQGQFDRCHQELDMAKRYLEGNLPNNKVLLAKYYQINGALLTDESKYKEALQQLTLSVDIYKKDKENSRRDAVNVMNLMGNIYLETSEYAKALNIYRQARQLLMTTPQKDLDSNSLANTLGNIGATFQYLEDWDSAYYYHTHSKRIYTAKLGTKHPKVANQLYNIALVDMETGKYDEAIKGYQQALSIYEKQEYPYHPELSEIYGSLGAVYAIKGEWEAAVNCYYQDSLHTVRTFGPKHPFMANCYQEIALTQINRGNYVEAIRLLHKARGIYELSYSINHNLFRNDLLLGKALFYNNNLLSSLSELEKAHKMAQALWKEPNSDFAEINLYEGHVLTGLGRIKEAKQKLNDCLSYFKQKGIAASATLCEAHLAMASVLSLENNNKGTLLEMKKGFLASQHNQAVLFPNEYTHACLAIAQHYEKNEKPLDALQYIDKAQIVSNRIRSNYAFETSSFAWSEKVSDLTEMGIRICYKLYHQDTVPNLLYLSKALAYMEYNKAFRLREHVSRLQRENLSGTSEKARETESRLKSDMAFYHAQLEAIGDGEEVDRKRLLFLQDKLFSLSNEYDQFLENVKKHHPEYYALSFDNNIPNIDAIIGDLAANRSLLIFHTTREYQYIIGLSKKSVPVFKRPSTQKMSSIIDDWIQAIMNNDIMRFRIVSFALYDSIFHGLPSTFYKNGLVVVPDKLLLRVPFEALLTRETREKSPKEFPYLIRRQSVIYSPSVALYLAKHDGWRNKKATITAFVPFFTTNSSGAFRELDAIKENFDCKIMVGQNANKSNLRKWMATSDIIHFATHGKLNNIHPLQSYLELSGQDTIDPLFAYEMYAMHTRARLVTLGSCHSGEGPVAGGEGSINMARAFMYCGAKNIVMTLWAVPDNTTSKVLSAFYKNIAKGLGKEEALRSSKISYLENCDPAGAMPIYWAGTVMTGDKYALKLNKPWPTRNWILTGLILLILGGVLGRFVYGKYVV